MNIGTCIVLILLITVVALAARTMIRDKKSGKACSGCAGGCSGCGGSCGGMASGKEGKQR